MSRTFPLERCFRAAASLTGPRLSTAAVGYPRSVRRPWAVTRRTLVAFYDDQMTHHAAALTYYALMSLFPTALVGLSLLGLLGQYPDTYVAITDYLEEVVPPSVIDPVDRSLRAALDSKGTALTALVVSIPLTRSTAPPARSRRRAVPSTSCSSWTAAAAASCAARRSTWRPRSSS